MEKEVNMISLLDISKKYNTDKNTVHTYIEDYYEEKFESYRFKDITLLEIGINAGGSVMMWKEYFTNAKIIGVDISISDELKQTLRNKNIEYIQGNATKENTFKGIDNLDIVIDDGSHKIDQILRSLKILYPKMNKNGLYVIEDVRNFDVEKNKFKNYDKKTFYDLRENQKHTSIFDDNTIIEIRS